MRAPYTTKLGPFYVIRLMKDDFSQYEPDRFYKEGGELMIFGSIKEANRIRTYIYEDLREQESEVITVYVSTGE